MPKNKTEEMTLTFNGQPKNIELVKKHGLHIYNFQQFCLATSTEYEDVLDWEEMHYESMALGFLLGCGVPFGEAVELAYVGNIEPRYPNPGVK